MSKSEKSSEAYVVKTWRFVGPILRPTLAKRGGGAGLLSQVGDILNQQDPENPPKNALPAKLREGFLVTFSGPGVKGVGGRGRASP